MLNGGLTGREILALAVKPETRVRLGEALAFDVDAARRYAELDVTARTSGRGFPTPDGHIAAIAASRGFTVAPRDTAPYEAAGIPVINPWES